jgi:hypothetical protein
MQAVERYIYGISVTVGTPPANGTFMVLENNNGLFVWGKNCKTCGRAPFYDNALSSSYTQDPNPSSSKTMYGFVVNSIIGYDTVCMQANNNTSTLCNDQQKFY